jgi:hypothetical protein
VLDEFLVNGKKNLILASKIMVQGWLTELYRVGDHLHRSPVIPCPIEELGGGPDDLVPLVGRFGF